MVIVLERNVPRFFETVNGDGQPAYAPAHGGSRGNDGVKNYASHYRSRADHV